MRVHLQNNASTDGFAKQQYSGNEEWGTSDR